MRWDPRATAGGSGNWRKREPACKPGSVEGSHSSGTHVAARLERPTRERRGPRQSLPYLVLLRVGFTLPPMLPSARCALTAPFHPYPRVAGGLFSVALSVGSRPPGVTWHPALRSPDFPPRRGERRSGCPADSRPPSVRPPAPVRNRQPGGVTDFLRMLEELCELFEMAGHPRSSPSSSAVGAETARCKCGNIGDVSAQIVDAKKKVDFFACSGRTDRATLKA